MPGRSTGNCSKPHSEKAMPEVVILTDDTGWLRAKAETEKLFNKAWAGSAPPDLARL